MPKPDSLKYVGEDKYKITDSGGVTQIIESTKTKDGNHLIIISGDGLNSWRLNDHRRFPKERYEKGTEVAIAVLDSDNELIGVGLGKRNNDNGVTIDRILHNNDEISELRKKRRSVINVEIEGQGDSAKVKAEDAEKLNMKVIMDVAVEVGNKRIEAGVLPRFHVAEARVGDKSPNVVITRSDKNESRFV